MKPLSGLLFAFALLAAGCSPVAAPIADDKSYDTERARQTLITALNAWEQEKASGLSRQKPPIRFVDDDLAAGCQLSDYEFMPDSEPIRAFQNTPVMLTVRNRRGVTVRKAANYQVTLEPELAVLRSDP